MEMAMQNFKMFLTVGTGSLNHGRVELSMHKPSLKTDPTTSLVGSRLIREVECEVDVPEFDLCAMEIEALEASVKSERADSQMRVNLLLDRISKLKCLTHEAEVSV